MSEALDPYAYAPFFAAGPRLDGGDSRPVAEVSAHSPSLWLPIETAEGAFFDVIAKYWDAGLDIFLVQRFTCVFKQDNRFIWPSPFPGDSKGVDLVSAGYRPTHWAPIPEPPK